MQPILCSGNKKAPILFNIFNNLVVVSETVMSRICQVTGKRPTVGNNVSHAKNRTKRVFRPNVHVHRFWVEEENRFIRLKVSANGMRTIDKLGIKAVLEKIRARGEKV